jgi:hypothetical protein
VGGAGCLAAIPAGSDAIGAARTLKGKGDMFSRGLLWFIPLTIVTTGCVRGGGALFGFGVLAGAAVVASQPVVVESVEIVQPPPMVFAVDPSPLAPPPTRHAPFDATAAKVALEQLDVGSCRAQGAPRGYVHARTTFANTGAVRKVIVDAPAGLSPEAVSCLGTKMGEANVPPFEGGDDVAVAVSLFVP